MPQLDEVSALLRPLTGFEFLAAAGLVPLDEFLGSPDDRAIHSTQYLRHPSGPLYTPEPDIMHEVIGHGNLLATSRSCSRARVGELTDRVCGFGDDTPARLARDAGASAAGLPA